jgi:hypothetical protein
MFPLPGALASPQRSISPRMLEIIAQFQQQAITPEYGRNLPCIQNPEVDDLRHALADMFGLPPLPLPLPASAGPAIPMDAISESQSRRDESRQSPAKSTVPSTRAHSPDSEGPSKRSNVGDIKDPENPFHRWVARESHKQKIEQDRRSDPGEEQYREYYHKKRQDSPPTQPSPTASSPPGLEDVPEEAEPEEPIAPIAGPSTMPGALSPTSPSDP